MEIVVNIKGEDREFDCTEIGCNNITLCEDGCIGFKPRNNKLKWRYKREVKNEIGRKT